MLLHRDSSCTHQSGVWNSSMGISGPCCSHWVMAKPPVTAVKMLGYLWNFGNQLLAALVLWFWGVRWDLTCNLTGWAKAIPVVMEAKEEDLLSVSIWGTCCILPPIPSYETRSYYPRFRDEKMEHQPGTHWWVTKLEFPPRSFWFQSSFYSPSGSGRIQGTYIFKKLIVVSGIGWTGNCMLRQWFSKFSMC